MRNILKNHSPKVLLNNKESWDKALSDNPSETNKNRYRHPDIKKALLEETFSKCVYCESKIGHNCPGDIEHKAPKSKRADLFFEWKNMTIACTECNRRKRDYYDPKCMFLDPNFDDVEKLVQHVGPLVFSRPGDKRSEVTVKILELDKIEQRKLLIAMKIEKLESLRNLVERIAVETNDIIKDFLIKELNEYYSIPSEYSGMVKTYIDELPRNWANNEVHQPERAERFN